MTGNRISNFNWVAPRRFLGLAAGLIVLGHSVGQDNEGQGGVSLEDLLQIGQELWEENAPPELQEEYRLPTIDEVEAFLADIETDMSEGSIENLASYATEAKVALQLLKQFEGGESLANWLEPRIDYLVVAKQIQDGRINPPQEVRPERPAVPVKPMIPEQYTQPYWDRAIAGRKVSSRADRYIPVFKKAFQSKGVPPELVWLSEVESSLNLKARSPAGAYGPFQFMPATAERFNLRVGFPDDRSNPKKSAEAAASYLSILYKQFSSWPLALAAYNAGEGRVGRAVESAGTSDFEIVSAKLPAETRMYVPKVLATIRVREAIDPLELPGI